MLTRQDRTGQDRTGQDRTGQDRTRLTDKIHRGVTSRPDEIKLNRQDYKYTGKS